MEVSRPASARGPQCHGPFKAALGGNTLGAMRFLGELHAALYLLFYDLEHAFIGAPACLPEERYSVQKAAKAGTGQETAAGVLGIRQG